MFVGGGGGEEEEEVEKERIRGEKIRTRVKRVKGGNEG